MITDGGEGGVIADGGEYSGKATQRSQSMSLFPVAGKERLRLVSHGTKEICGASVRVGMGSSLERIATATDADSAAAVSVAVAVVVVVVVVVDVQESSTFAAVSPQDHVLLHQDLSLHQHAFSRISLAMILQDEETKPEVRRGDKTCKPGGAGRESHGAAGVWSLSRPLSEFRRRFRRRLLPLTPHYYHPRSVSTFIVVVDRRR